MNFARKAAEAGGSIRFYDVHKHGPLVSRSRQAKKELGLSGRQLKKLRKAIAREERLHPRPAFVPHGVDPFLKPGEHP